MSKKKIILNVLLAFIIVAAIAGTIYALAMQKANSTDTAKTNQYDHEHYNNMDMRDGGSSAQPTESVSNRCNASKLSMTQAVDQGGGTAGSITSKITATNTSAADCTIGGYPGVSLINDAGQAIGQPADRSKETYALITLSPNESASASIRAVNNNFEPGICKEGATKLRIYPPSDTSFLDIATTTTTWCPGFAINPFK